MYENVAYSFKSNLALEELRERLNKGNRWEWLRRNSDRFDDYISALANPDWGMLKVYVEKDHYVIDVVFRSARAEAAAEFEALHKLVLERVLPSVDAREVKAVKGYDS